MAIGSGDAAQSGSLNGVVPSAAVVQDRLLWQEEAICTLLDGLRELAQARIEGQEAALAEIYRPMTRRAAQRVRRNRERLRAIVAPIEADVRARVRGLDAQLQRLVDVVGPPPGTDGGPATAEPPRGGAPRGILPGQRTVFCDPELGQRHDTDPWKESAAFEVRLTESRCVYIVPRSSAEKRFCGLGLIGSAPQYLGPQCATVERVPEGGAPRGDTPPGWQLYGPFRPEPREWFGGWVLYVRANVGDPACLELFQPCGKEPPPDGEPDACPPPPCVPRIEGVDDEKMPSPPFCPPEEGKDGECPKPVECPPCKDEPPAPKEPPAPIRLPIEACILDWGDYRSCQTIEEALDAWAMIGEAIITGKDLPGSLASKHAVEVEILAQLPVVGPVFRWLAKSYEMQARMSAAVETAIADARKQGKGHRYYILAGLWVARAALRFLEGVPVAISWPVWLGGQLQIELTQLARMVDYLIEYVCPTRAPSTASVAAMWMGDVISDKHAACLAAVNGDQWPVVRLEALARRAQPTADQVYSLYMRGVLSEDETARALRSQGWLDERDMARFGRTRDFLPPPSDLIRFAVKDVFDPHKPGREEMLEELKLQSELRVLLAQQGIRDIPGADGKGGLRTWNITDYYWLASFVEISPTQAHEALHRLRPNRTRRYRQVIRPTKEQLALKGVSGARIVSTNPDGTWTIEPNAFTFVDVLKLLKEVDYNPVYRPLLASIAYRPIGRIDARRMYALGVYGPPRGMGGVRLDPDGTAIPLGPAERELAEVYEDMGYSRADALDLVRYTAAEWDRGRARTAAHGLKSAVCQMFSAGGMSEAFALRQLESVGIEAGEARAAVADCSLRLRARQLRAAIAATRKLFMRGAMSRNEAGAQLARVGVEPGAVASYLNLWAVQRAGEGPEVRAQEMCGWAAMGLITYEEMARRLRNQGYSEIDTLRIVRHCQLGILAKGAKEQRAAARAAESAARRAASERRRMEREAERRAGVPQKGVFASEISKDVAKWWKEGVITEGQVDAMLRRKEWSRADVEIWKKANRPKK